MLFLRLSSLSFTSLSFTSFSLVGVSRWANTDFSDTSTQSHLALSSQPWFSDDFSKSSSTSVRKHSRGCIEPLLTSRWWSWPSRSCLGPLGSWARRLWMRLWRISTCSSSLVVLCLLISLINILSRQMWTRRMTRDDWKKGSNTGTSRTSCKVAYSMECKSEWKERDLKSTKTRKEKNKEWWRCTVVIMFNSLMDVVSGWKDIW